MNRTSRPEQRRCSISEARARLPELARFLASHPDQVEILEHRDLAERLAIITESHLRYLELTVAELKKRCARPFRLGGSISSKLGDDDLAAALRTMREEAHQRSLEELNNIVG